MVRPRPSLRHSFVMMEIVSYLQAQRINRLPSIGGQGGGGRRRRAASETDLSCNGGTEQEEGREGAEGRDG